MKYNPYKDIYLITYLTKEYGDYLATDRFDFPPELSNKSLNIVDKEISEYILSQPLRNRIVGYTIKIYEEGTWVEIYRNILRENPWENVSSARKTSWMKGADWIKY